MGNQQAQLAPASIPAQPNEYLGDLPGVVFKDSLGGGRFLKTVGCCGLTFRDLLDSEATVERARLR